MSENNKYIVYKSKLGETVPKIFLNKLFNLNLEKILEKNDARTPDYIIKDSGNNTIAICEVKTLIDTPDVFDSNYSVEDLAKTSEKRNKNHRAKLRRHLGEALNQLKNFSECVTFVIFVSFDMTDYMDLDMVLNDKETFPNKYESDGYIIIKAHQKLTPSNQFEISDTAHIMYNPGKGESFSKKYLSTEMSLKNVGVLPLVFKLQG